MTRTSKYLNQDTIAALQSFQIEKIDGEITDYLDTNNKMNTYHFEYCPKCGCYHPRLIKSGFANTGKQMLRCKSCGKRFVVDRSQLTFYSHQDQSKWNELILDTLNGVSLKETAAKINLNERNVFNIRHKLLISLGTEEYPIHSRKWNSKFKYWITLKKYSLCYWVEKNYKIICLKD